MKRISFLILIFVSYLSNAQIKDVNLNISGLSEEYANKFRSEKNEIIEQINDIGFPESISPVKIDVTYKDGEGWVTLSLNYVHDDFFSNYSSYTKHNDNWRGMGKGISFLFVDRLLQVLSVYKYEVAKDGYTIDKDLAKFKSCIELISGSNYIQVYAYNYLGDPYRGGAYPQNFYKNVNVKYGNKYVEVITSNPTTLNEMKFFYIGKTTGLDGQPTGDFYFAKFFKIDEWESPAERAEKRKLQAEQERKDRERKLQEEFENKVKNGIGYVYSSQLSNENDIKLTIDAKAIPIIYDYILQVKEKYPEGYNNKIETYENNLKYAESRGNKPEDYAMFSFDLFFNKDKSIGKIELSRILIKGSGMKNIEIPASVFSALKNYFNLNVIPIVNLGGNDYQVNSSYMLFFTFNETNSEKTIDFQISKSGEITYLSEISESLLKFFSSNSKITSLEKGKYSVNINVLNTNLRISHYQNFNKPEKIENNQNEYSIKIINKL